MIAHELGAAGYDVTEARTGAELLEHLHEALLLGQRSARPDVIVSDIRMPGFFGLDILAGLRDEKWSTGMIVMSAYADQATRARVAGLGAAFLEKPFTCDDLLEALRDICRARRPAP